MWHQGVRDARTGWRSTNEARAIVCEFNFSIDFIQAQFHSVGSDAATGNSRSVMIIIHATILSLHQESIRSANQTKYALQTYNNTMSNSEARMLCLLDEFPFLYSAAALTSSSNTLNLLQ